MWNRVVEKQGAGPRGIGITKITEPHLKPLLKSLWEDSSYKESAEKLAGAMAQEDYAKEIINRIVAGD